uniref:serine hydrolase domain-containing protein n=1 Tax=uncultured Draconibacterium sp. TaxID=1573823 RepID=UPI003216E9CC
MKIAIFFTFFVLTLAAKEDYSRICFSETFDKIDSIVKTNELPGISICIINKDSVLECYFDGYSNIEDSIKVDGHTAFKIGSITKTFIGLAFHKLSYEGKIDLSQPVKEIVPEVEFKNPWHSNHPIRIIHLLEHTAGFDDIYVNDVSLDDISSIPIYDVLKKQKKQLVARWQPGSFSSYSSTGYTLLGYILEKVTGMRYEEYLINEILKPIGMKNTSPYLNQFPYSQTVCYEKKSIALRPICFYARPAGSMFSTANDMNKFLRFLLKNESNGESVYLPVEVVRNAEKITTNLASKKGIEIGMGSGIFSTFKNGTIWNYHNGGGPGCTASLYYCKEKQIGFCILTNTFNISAVNKIKELIFNEVASQPILIKQEGDDSDFRFYGYFRKINHRQEKFSLLDDIFSDIRIWKHVEDLKIKEIFSQDVYLNFIGDDKFQSSDGNINSCWLRHKEDAIFFFKGSFYKKSPIIVWYLKWIFIIFLSIIIVTLSACSIVFTPVCIYKTVLNKKLSRFQSIILFQQGSIILLVVPLILVSTQSMIYLGQKTFPNVALFIGSLLFPIYAVGNVFYSFKNRNQQFKYLLLFSASILLCFAIVLLSYGYLGIRLWK